jgi:hypothetical protein
MPYQFNIGTTGQFAAFPSTPVLNQIEAVTFEGMCTLFEDGENPTIIARPLKSKWEPPYVVYRLGFHNSKRIPEFQLLFEKDEQVTTIRADRSLELHRPTHIAGTYDGSEMRLYVDGLLIASAKKRGRLASSNEPTVVAARSNTDPGGFLVGTLQELRIWRIARTAEEINLWKRRLLPIPAPETCIGLYEMEPSPPEEVYTTLQAKGFSPLEISLVNIINGYGVRYNDRAELVLSEKTQTYYPKNISHVTFVRAKDGYCAFYEPTSEVPRIHFSGKDGGGILVSDKSDLSLTEVFQKSTDNRVKILSPQLNKPLESATILPNDIPDAKNYFINPILRDNTKEIPSVAISPPIRTHNGVVIGTLPNRVRAIAPLIRLPNGTLVRGFKWLFADIWFGELTRETVHLPNALRLVDADLQILQWIVDLALPPELTVNNGPMQVIRAMELLLQEFEQLLNKPDVDEVRDIQPFLADPKRWVLLNPYCKHVWPQKLLGNKYKVDFILEESDGSYTAIEIESPNFPLFTKSLKRHYKLRDAEDQVRDYCDYIDRNLDSVEREEELAGIFRPRGVVVIGRRRTLRQKELRKLASLNRENGRYTIMTYDDLIDRVKALINSIRTLISP